MPVELELKTIVPDPAVLRERLAAAGARPAFRGLMEDRRYDRDGQLTARDEVLRVRRFLRADGVITAELTWCRIEPGSDPPGRIVEALGYTVVQAIDRWVELFELGGAVLRVEWYPRMDVLLEVEGPPEAIETAIRATGLPREGFSAEVLLDFVRRYDARGSRLAALTLAELGDERPAWETT